MNWGFGAAGQGIWPAIWWRPEDSGLGEIDTMEAWLGINDLHSTIWRDYTGTPHVEGGSKPPPFDPSAWHVYGTEKWNGGLRFYIDGVLIWDATNAASWRPEAFDRNILWHLRLQIQVGAVKSDGSAGYGGWPNGGTDFTKTFDIDYVSVKGAGTVSKLVFAHYFPPYPLNRGNKTPPADYYTQKYIYPAPGGYDPPAASGYKGLLRDAPYRRKALATTNWQQANAATEVGWAKEAGIDGWVVDILTLSSSTTANNTVYGNAVFAASEAAGFYCIPMLDMTSINTKTEAQVADTLNHFLNYNCTLKVGAKTVFTAFYTEGWTPAQWASLKNYMLSNYGKSLYFVGCFNHYSDISSQAYDGVCDGYGTWGNRYAGGNPTGTGSGTPKGNIADVQARGKIWMQPVSVQDSRPNQAKYWEANNTENMRNTLDIAIAGGANWIQIPTWNDFSENAHIVPSDGHGFSFLDALSYYIQWFHYNAQPAIAKDAILLTHRKHGYGDVPGGVTPMVLQSGGTTPARDTIEALFFLTASATLTITVNGTPTTWTGGPGIVTHTVALPSSAAAGAISAKITRSAVDVATVTSTLAVTSTPTVQDLKYYGFSSLRGNPAAPSAIPLPPPIADVPPLPPPPPPVLLDDFANRVSISGASGTYTNFDNTAFGVETGEEDYIDTTKYGATGWFEWTCPADGVYEFSTQSTPAAADGSGWNSFLNVYTVWNPANPPSVPNLDLLIDADDDIQHIREPQTGVTSDDTASTIYIKAFAGTTYYIQLGGYFPT
jgi:hypothetical protein